MSVEMVRLDDCSRGTHPVPSVHIGVIPRGASAVLASRPPLYLPTTGWTTFPLPSQISPQRGMMMHYIDPLSAIAFGTVTFPGTQSLVVTESCYLLEAEGQLCLNSGMMSSARARTREIESHCVGDSSPRLFFLESTFDSLCMLECGLFS